MYETYNKIYSLLACILEPAPLNQLGMPEYCRHILSVLAEVKSKIEELEDSYRRTLSSFDMDEEF